MTAPTHGLPVTAEGWIDAGLETARRAYEKCWESGALPPPVEHMALVNVQVSGGVEAILWEALRLAAPEAADRLAADVADICDDGGVLSELMYEWRERRAAGEPISRPSPHYSNVWQDAGLTVQTIGGAA